MLRQGSDHPNKKKEKALEGNHVHVENVTIKVTIIKATISIITKQSNIKYFNNLL